MKPSCLQVVFVAMFLLLAVLVLRHGGHGFRSPAFLPSAQAQEAPFGPARPARAADRTAAISVIQAQLKALQKGDYPRVIQYQSSGLKRHFASVAAFRHMMETNYPAFLNFQSFSFGPGSTPDGGRHLAIPVTLQKGIGVKLPVLYLMVREGKTYKVDGVEGGMAPPPDANPGASQVT